MLNEYDVISKVGQNVLAGYLGLIVETSELQQGANSIESNGVGVALQIIGQMEGQFISTMSTATVKELVSRMMGGYEVQQLDEMCWSAFQEFGNWFVSGIATELASQGIQVNITQPLLHEGDVTYHSINNYTVVTMTSEIGKIDVYMQLEEAQTTK
ncbi:chemotaxis protein CheX [Paenibacillus taihuensis]|uniref:Chemotaxis protein CheX n=1 Tax=Paenibacillus taihuensis TaxID=1156355 RepID=A0A3D9RQW0_9BACL|nr:chemotaxis protein CheX [Paenibacillus taihuensis]REE77730.1 chemotaxis protein CheX [Paenibacillus taihuensis]